MVEKSSSENTGKELEDVGFDFIVDEDDEVEVSIWVASVTDASGKRRPYPVNVEFCKERLKLLKSSKELIERRLKEIDEDENSSSREADRMRYMALLDTANDQIATLENLIEAPKVKLTSYWKIPDWDTVCQINSESLVLNERGEPEFSEERNRRVRVKYLLKRWDLKDRSGRPIPVTMHNKVDGSVIEAFLTEFDRRTAFTRVDSKN